jgi:hypothetical protein
MTDAERQRPWRMIASSGLSGRQGRVAGGSLFAVAGWSSDALGLALADLIVARYGSRTSL